MPDFANMTEEEQIAFAMQMSMQDARKSFAIRIASEFSNKFILQRNLLLNKQSVQRKMILQWT